MIKAQSRGRVDGSAEKREWITEVFPAHKVSRIRTSQSNRRAQKKGRKLISSKEPQRLAWSCSIVLVFLIFKFLHQLS